MKTVVQQLSDYLDDQDGYEITTSKGITISAWNDWLLHAEFTLAETEEATLDVSFCCDKKSFVKVMAIRNVMDIHHLTQKRLMELFHEGLAELICNVYLDSSYVMAFQKLRNSIVALNEWGIKHNIPKFEKLETPDQYIAYAMQYYKRTN
jgi:hypothetical protein